MIIPETKKYTKLPPTKVGSFPSKKYVKGAITGIIYGKVDENKMFNAIEGDELKALNPSEIKMVIYITFPESDTVIRTSPMSLSLHEKSNLRKIAIAAMGEVEGLKLKDVEELIGKELEVLGEKKKGQKGTEYIIVKDYGSVWSE